MVQEKKKRRKTLSSHNTPNKKEKQKTQSVNACVGTSLKKKRNEGLEKNRKTRREKRGGEGEGARSVLYSARH